MTDAQRNALDRLWPGYGLDAAVVFDPLAVFGRSAPLVLEIGFGNGETLVQMAGEQPETDFIGIEVHRPGVGHLLLQADERKLTNLRVYCADAVSVLENCLPDASLDRIHLFFPDPWPKKRHHKRRIVNPEFVRLVANKLKSGGIFHLATDWKDYADQMLQVTEENGELENRAGRHAFAPRPESRPMTKFEGRGRRLGHGVWDLMLLKSTTGQ